ncbi:LacI family transcriptional regulator [Paenibacillus sp. IHB B 3415]|uniref:LacI family DNA-binding transcriptional regulator n=1 Tax=Paenibacillus sp. IHB B 3415 TaxID=867080 RepID=UPI000575BF03|nr:LacI family DNA-binding transcriptional regulator [Paenibacillus sp. IHB B 3415]KHL97190.1 LacI family transcriptional regulator [Paenibacillus sp. IHB B 3415]
MKSTQISIKEIARLSGVSVATVSRVINNNGRFSEETREKVIKVIEENQYEINSIAKSLRMNKSQTIGVLVPDISNEFFAAVVLEIERFFFEEGYSTIICNTAKNADKEKEYLKTLDGKMVDGLVCISGQEEVLTNILKRKVPIVCIDRRPKVHSNVAFVESNHYEGGRMATEELIRKGCRDILVLTKKNNLSSVNERLSGYMDALKEAGLPVHEYQIVYIDTKKDNLEAAKLAIQNQLDQRISFDGIFATNDWMGLGALLVLQENGYKIPEQVKIVGFDNILISKYCNPPMTTIDQDRVVLANKACRFLLDMIEGNALASELHQVVPVTLIQRHTT